VILLFSFVCYHEVDCLERTEHFLYCILYAFISILCRSNLLFVTLVLPFFELRSAISSLWASIWCICCGSKPRKDVAPFVPPKENLSEQTCLVALDYASLYAHLGDAVQASLYFGWNWSLLFACCLAISVMD